MTRRLAACAALLLFASAAAAQEPPRAARMVVTFPAGGTADVLARLVADAMGRATGATIVVDNRPGANSIVGNEVVARAAPDGATFLEVANSFLITAAARQLRYDPLSSFAPICSLVDSPLVVAVAAASPYRSIGDLLADAKARPGQVTTAAIGPATAQRVAVELLKRSAGVDVSFVPYPSNAQALNALLGGEIASVTVNIADAVGLAADKRVRFLATFSPRRVAGWPDTPTLRESGYDVSYAVWFGLVAPAKTPQPVLDSLAAAVTAAMRSPDLDAKVAPLQFYPNVVCGQDFAAFLTRESEITGRIVREAGITMD